MAEGQISISLKIEGLDKAMAKLNKIADNCPKKADNIIEDVGETVFADSQNLCPVDTGTLLASGSHNHSFLRSEVGYNCPYAAAQEFGTSKMDAQPYLRPAAAQAPSELKKRMAEIIKE